MTSPWVIMKHKSAPWRQGRYGNSRRQLHFSLPADNNGSRSSFFMVHFRIDDVPLNFCRSTCLNMKESRPHSFLYHTQVCRVCQSTMLKNTTQTPSIRGLMFKVGALLSILSSHCAVVGVFLRCVISQMENFEVMNMFFTQVEIKAAQIKGTWVDSVPGLSLSSFRKALS